MIDTLKFDVGTNELKNGGSILIRVFTKRWQVKSRLGEAPLLHLLRHTLLHGRRVEDLRQEFPEFEDILTLLQTVLAQGTVDVDSMSEIREDGDFGYFIHFTLA